jgi:zinc transport system substrate-binding protein
MKKIALFLALILPLSIALSGCSGSTDNSSQSNSGKISVYTTVFPLQYFAERIGAEHVNVKTIYPPGADEHTFEPSQRDMMNLADSDLFFYVGLGLEGFIEKSKATLKSENVELVPAGEEIDFSESTDNESPHDSHEEEEHEEDAHASDSSEGHNHGDVNPHVWLDPLYSKDLALAIKDSLIKESPEQKADFENNYEQLTKELDELNHSFEETIHNAKQKKIIVTHAAFGYWEERYGLEQISISGLSTSNEPSQKELEKIIKTANDEGIKYIMFEQNITSQLGEIVEKEIGAKALHLHNLSTLTEKDIESKETYFTLMKKNVEALKISLNE